MYSTKQLQQIKDMITVKTQSYTGKRETKWIQHNTIEIYENVPIWKTRGIYRKEMKRGYNKILYNQRNKNETILSVIKRTVWRIHITSRLIIMQNRELTIRYIAYNVHRMLNLFFMGWILQSQKFNNYYFTITKNRNLLILNYG